MKLAIPHWVIVVLTLVATLTPKIADAFPGNTVIAGIVATTVQLATVASAVVGILSGSAMSAQKATEAAAGIATKALVVLALLSAALALSGCGQPVFPTLSKVEQAVANDLAAGAGEPQIDQDACAALGGSALTDSVCIGVTSLVVDVVGALLESGAVSGQAATNAASLKAAHMAQAGGK